jgi:high-affinity nickel-transport protein
MEIEIAEPGEGGAGVAARITRAFTRDEWLRLGLFGAAIAALHVAGWGLFLWYSSRYQPLVGLGLTAYLFGLRHAFDADHIAAIDNTTRKLLAEERRPLGVGFFFSLGHATVVIVLAGLLAIATRTADGAIPAFQHYGGYVSAGVSAGFLWAIGLLNLVVLIDIVRIFREMRGGEYDRERLENRLLERGMMSRFFGRFFRLIDASWKMFPLGLLFGLGFDTATEIGLLAVAGGVASHDVPLPAVMSLPLLFAAGMGLMDTADGAFMTRAYGWAFSNPVRKVYYNITVTSLSIVVALAIGTVELLQVVSTRLALSGGFWDWLNGLDFETLGYAVVALFLLMWAMSVSIWKLRRIEERWAPAGVEERVP